MSYLNIILWIGKGRVFRFQSLFRVCLPYSLYIFRCLGRVYYFSLLICYSCSSNKLFSQLVSDMAVLKGYIEFVIYKCWRIFDIILWLTSAIFDHMQKRKLMQVKGKSAWKGFNIGLDSDHVTLKSQVSLSKSFLSVLSLYFNTSVAAVRIFLSCSMMFFPWLLKSWSCLLKLHWDFWHLFCGYWA